MAGRSTGNVKCIPVAIYTHRSLWICSRTQLVVVVVVVVVQADGPSARHRVGQPRNQTKQKGPVGPY
jgi:hypothetical protein